MKVTEVRKLFDGGWKNINLDANEIEGFEQNVKNVLSRANLLTLINLDEKGNPRAKTMTYNGSQDLDKIWFCTNASSKRAAQLMKNSLTTVYYNDSEKNVNLELIGHIYVETDLEWLKKCWKSFYEDGFKGGIYDPDYLVLRFESNIGYCTYNEVNISFEME